jgi:hypothetical protein
VSRVPNSVPPEKLRAKLIASGALRERPNVLRIDEIGLWWAAYDIAETEDVTAVLENPYTDYRIALLLRERHQAWLHERPWACSE